MRKKGFSLVEIMLVVSIVFILAAIVIVAGDSARKVARDNQRKSDISLLQLKLESYRGQYGKYPTTLNDSTFAGFTLPKDPSTKLSYQYVPLAFDTNTCGTSYHLGADLENNNTASPAVINDLLIECGAELFVMEPNKTFDVTSPK